MSALHRTSRTARADRGARPARRRTPRTAARGIASSALGAGLVVLLAACTGTDAGSEADASTTTTAAGSDATPTDARPTDDTPTDAAGNPVDTDSVQTDAPVTSSALVLTWAEYSADSSSIDAAAFVQGVVEADGTCVLTASRRGKEYSSDPTTAVPGPNTTDCGGMSVRLPAGSSGSWDVSVTYSSSSTAELTSASTEVEVP